MTRYTIIGAAWFLASILPLLSAEHDAVSASAIINTFFIRVLPQWKTMNVSSSSQALRVRLIMMLVLDRSGSMRFNDGANALPGAVSSFIPYLRESFDEIVHAETDRVPRTDPCAHFARR